MMTREQRVASLIDRHGERYDGDCGFYFGCACGWDNDSDSSNSGYAEHVAAEVERLLKRMDRERIRMQMEDGS